MFAFMRKPTTLPSAAEALPGRSTAIAAAQLHAVNKRPLTGPYPADAQEVLFGLGCFWGAERKFWQTPGVWVTAVGYAGGLTPNPTYEEVCSGRTGHNEVVRIVYRPQEISFEALLKVFFESHNPTQGMQQGNDVGTQYRSGIYVAGDERRWIAEAAKRDYDKALAARGFEPITTEVLEAPVFYYAEDYHQQYLEKNPRGYCGLGGTGVTCQIGTGVSA
jgi:peptide-methionine (S)-S-oxide reductase